MKYPNTAIFFDMDNTLIKSFIDYALMKSETVRLLRQYGLPPADEKMPVAKMMALAERNEKCTPEIAEAVWKRINEVEDAGLSLAVPENGAVDLLRRLSADTHILLLTNNVHASAAKTLERMGVMPYLSVFAGRGVVPALKPSPAGYQYLLNQLSPKVDFKSCLATGDALIDIQAASELGVDFIAYNGSREEDWQRHSVMPRLYLRKWNDEAYRQICELLDEKNREG